MRTLTCDPDLETIGQTVLSFVENVQEDEIHPYLVRHHLTDIKPDHWYPVKDFLDMLNDMAEGTNLTSNLVAIGMQIPLRMLVPPEMETASLKDILFGWDALYHLQHRGCSDIGYVKAEEVNSSHIKTIHNHYYPDDFCYGIAYGMAKRWLPKTSNFLVKYDERLPRRDVGGDVTIIHVEWENS